MDLGDNRLSGTIPSLRFANLNTLNLGTNDFEGPIPYSIASLSNLKHLDLSSNKLSSTLPPSFGQLSVLQKLKLGYNSIYGVFKADFTSFGGGLKELNLTSNSFGGSIEFLQMFPLLEQLDLSSNKFGGTIPMKLGVDLQNLKSIVFSHNQLQGSLPSSLGKLSGLRHLAGSDNKFSGEFPWGSFSDNENSMMLTYISMADNFLSGTLPLDMFRFGALEVIDFQKNQISGSIPIAIGWVSGLKELHLSSNGLTGIVPQSLGRLSSMAILNVAGNMLSSTIPTTLGRLANSLKTLKLHSNDFSGEVPSELGGLDYLGK